MLPFRLSKRALLAFFLVSCSANLLTSMNANADQRAVDFQPVLDFDKDGCYQTAAIDGSGRVNEGLELHRGDCRQSRLQNSQTYVRQRCNNGWCAYLYGYYFERDWPALAGGHTHDWEHIIVWTLHHDIFFVSWSAHGEYTTAHRSGLRWEGNHPKIVYHLGAKGTHSFRRATASDDNVENETGKWHQAPLLSLEMLPCDLNRKLLNHNWGSAHPDLTRDRFGRALDMAMPSDARYNEHFDPWR